MTDPAPSNIPDHLRPQYESRRKEGLCCYVFEALLGGQRFTCGEMAEEACEVCAAHLEERSPEQEAKVRELFDKRMADDKSDFHDFRGWRFPEGFKFPEEFKKEVDFSHAHFEGGAAFRETHFEGETHQQPP